MDWDAVGQGDTLILCELNRKPWTLRRWLWSARFGSPAPLEPITVARESNKLIGWGLVLSCVWAEHTVGMDSWRGNGDVAEIMGVDSGLHLLLDIWRISIPSWNPKDTHGKKHPLGALRGRPAVLEAVRGKAEPRRLDSLPSSSLPAVTPWEHLQPLIASALLLV